MGWEAKEETFDPKNMRCPPQAHMNLKNFHHQPLAFSLDLKNESQLKKPKRQCRAMYSTQDFKTSSQQDSKQEDSIDDTVNLLTKSKK